jgi:SAM-dependent methyltransferase
MSLRHGYFTGAGYTYGAYSEPSPERLALLCLLRGHRPPDLTSAFRLLELGCGQGFHLCLQAANYPDAQFVGIDFNPDHIAHASSLAAAAGLTNIAFHQADFLALEQNAGVLGDSYDLAVAHGILGWVSPRVGAALLRLTAAALRPGGVFYLSYNALPGWLAALPFQHTIQSLQAHHGDGMPALEAARNLFHAIKDVNGQLFAAQPALAPRLEGLAGLDPAYLLHEYNHSEWQPLYANQVILQGQQLGLAYLGSATLMDNFEGLLPEPYRQLIQQHDPAMKELVRDLLINQSFRRDVYVKGLDPLWSGEALACLEGQRVLGVADPEALAQDDAFHFRLGFGEVKGNREWFQSLMQSVQDSPVSLADLRGRLHATAFAELLQNLALLLGKGLLVLVPPERDPQPAQRFNRLIARQVAAGAPYRHLACPVSGNVHCFSDIDLLAFHALQQGCPEAELLTTLDAGLQALDRKPMRDGQAVEGTERQAVLESMVETLRRRTLPLMRRLEVLT